VDKANKDGLYLNYLRFTKQSPFKLLKCIYSPRR
jgi:hypothetical protein